MDWIIPVIALAGVAAFFAWKNKDKIAEHLAKSEPTAVLIPVAPVEKPAPGAGLPPITATVTVITPKYDYARWGGYTPYDLQTMAGRADGPFPRGVPPDWDWKEWARVNGRVDPTAPVGEPARPRPSGFTLTANAEPVVNTLNPGQDYPYAFTVEGSCWIEWAPQGTGGYLEAWITQARDGPRLAEVKQLLNFGKLDFTGSGGYFLHLKLDRGPFVVGVQQNV